MTSYIRRLASSRRLCVVLLACAAVAMAAPTQAATFDATKSKLCRNVNACSVEFNAIPSGKTVLLTEATCTLLLSSGAKIDNIQLRRMSGGKRTGFQMLAPLKHLPDQYGEARYELNVDALLAMKEADQPAVFIRMRSVTDRIEASCQLLGTID